MMDSIDAALRILGTAELPAQSCDIERGVVARIAAVTRAREARPSLGVGLGAAVLALSVGLVSGSAAPAAKTMPLEVSVFSANAAFAPATLLATAG